MLPKSQAMGSDKDRRCGVGPGRERWSSVQAGLSHDLARERPWVAHVPGPCRQRTLEASFSAKEKMPCDLGDTPEP